MCTHAAASAPKVEYITLTSYCDPVAVEAWNARTARSDAGVMSYTGRNERLAELAAEGWTLVTTAGVENNLVDTLTRPLP